METRTLSIRGLELHVQEWGYKEKPLLLLLHGWMDCGASFKYLAESLKEDFFVVAPDLRGFGRSEHADSYWFPDYFADLECLLDHYSPDRSVNLVGHSMGGNIAMLYAGIQAHRVRRVMSLEALGLAPTEAAETPEKYRRWLREILSDEPPRLYPTLDAFCFSIKKANPTLSNDMILELADLWGEEVDVSGGYRMLHDHKHRYANPYRYHYEDSLEIWKQITAKVGVVMAQESKIYKGMNQFGRISEVRELLNVKDDAYFLIENSGHMLHLEQPQKTADCIKDFLTSAI